MPAGQTWYSLPSPEKSSFTNGLELSVVLPSESLRGVTKISLTTGLPCVALVNLDQQPGVVHVTEVQSLGASAW